MTLHLYVGLKVVHNWLSFKHCTHINLIGFKPVEAIYFSFFYELVFKVLSTVSNWIFLIVYF